MKQTRREFVRILFAAGPAAVAGRWLSGPVLAESAPAAPGGLNFLVVGDWGRNGERDQAAVAAQMAATAGATGARFVISTGDNFYEDGVASTTDPQWQSSFEQVYSATSLQVPWHVALGNHDYHGNCDAQIDYTRTSPRWKIPARHFVHSEPVEAAVTADFFFLDTTPLLKIYYAEGKTRAHVMTQDTKQQLDWFKTALAASTAPWKIVIGHHPIFSGGEHGDSPELIEKILPLLVKFKVRAYFNGHDHDLQHLTAGNVNLFDSGAGSQVRPTKKTVRTKFAAAGPGFMAVTLRAGQMDVRMIDYRGNLLYAAAVPRVPT